MRSNIINKFSDGVDNLSSSLVGGKALLLSVLYKKGFPVPDGFVINSRAFDHILAQIYKECGKYKICTEDIRKNIIKSKIPPELTETINDSFDSLNTVFVAVRSSASLEDGEKHSYAGQFESFLGVNKGELLPKISLCWASFFGRRAVAYSKMAGNTGKMAVIIQQMVEADVSGVCFSIDPVSEDAKTIVMETVSGPGEMLVQGSAVPDRYILDKETLIIKEKHVNMNVIINAEAVKEVAGVAAAIEKLFGGPIDMEWALSGGRLYVLQARPVTALKNVRDLTQKTP